MSNRSTLIRGALSTSLALTISAWSAAPRSGESAFRDLYRELVETNTTLSAGDCTLAAQKLAARLKAAHFSDADVQVFTAPDHPKEGGLFAQLGGKDAKKKALLLLGHLDVVEAKREDWTRDPFTLVEENGYFYARGASDDKAMSAIWVDTLVRMRTEHFQNERTIKLALTCGEETTGAFNGARWLSTERKDLIDAAFALNEGAGGQLDEKGKRVMLGVQAGEKSSQNFRLEVLNVGGHSSRPQKNNAIYHLAAGLTRLSQYDFPIQLNEVTRTFFSRASSVFGPELGGAMANLAKDPTDAKAVALVTADPTWNGLLHTTCVATMLDAGHATNALPQRARANINCRIFPGTSDEEVRQTLIRVVDDPSISVTRLEVRGPPAIVPPLTNEVLGPIEKNAAKHFPGVPVIPLLSAGATDAQFLGTAGIPTYGVSGLFADPDGGGVHGLNERVRVQSLFDARDFLFDLVKAYTAKP